MAHNPLSFDYTIIGAGLIGSSTAMHLSRLLAGKGKSIAVLDADTSGLFSSSELNAGGARATWTQELNIKLSKESLDFLKRNKVETGFQNCGYLWLQKKENEEESKKNIERWNSYGLETVWLNKKELQERHPFIDKAEDLSGAIFSPKDGLFNPNRLKELFREVAVKNSVEFRNKHRVLGIKKLSNDTIELECSIVENGEEAMKEFLSQNLNEQAKVNIQHIQTKVLINCTGAWSGDIAKLCQHPALAQPIRRQISVFHNKEVDMRACGLIVDTSKVYFHPESDNILAGYSEPSEAAKKNLSYGGIPFFEEKIWMPLYKRSSKFSQLKHVTGWAGLYSVTPDSTAILGRVPGEKNIYESYGYSGRGAMQSYGAGRGLAELVALGSFESMNLSGLSAERFQNKKLIPEETPI